MRPKPKRSPIPDHTIDLSGHKTSVTLEDEFWKSLREIAKERRKTIKQLITDIDAKRNSANLSSAIRLFVLDYYRKLVDQLKDEIASHRSNSIENERSE